jgi:hypothetical protein
MTFGEALEKCKQGARITRGGWNGKGQFVYYQKGGTVAAENLRCDAIKEYAQKSGNTEVEIMGHFDIRTSAGVIQCGWLATQSDMQADDWEIA